MQFSQARKPSLLIHALYTTQADSLKSSISPRYASIHIYKAKAAKAKTTDRAIAIELTVEPAAPPVAWAGEGPVELGLPLPLGRAAPLD